MQAEQHVVALDVTMDDPVSMEMLKTLARFPGDGGNLTLAHQIGGDHIRQTSALHVLHNHPQLGLIQERVYEVDDVRVPRGLHYEDLVDNEILLRLFIEVHLLDGDGIVGADLVCGEDTSRCAIQYVGDQQK